MNITLYNKNFEFNKIGFYTHITPSAPCALHNHDFYEIFYVMDGKVMHYVNNNEVELTLGDMVILRPSDTHKFVKLKEFSGTRRDLLFKKSVFEKACNCFYPEFLEKLKSTYLPIKFRLTSEQISRLEYLSSKIHALFDADAEKSRVYVKLLISTIIETYLESLSEKSENYPLWLKQLISVLNEVRYLNTPINEYLGRFNYNKPYMRRVFKEYTGVTISSYYLNVKLKYADMLLRTTNSTINVVAEKCGFNSNTYFFREFKKKYGFTPAKYRKKQ